MINDLAQEWAKDGHHVEVVTHCPSYPFGHPYDGYINGEYKEDRWGEIIVHRLPFIEGYKDSRVKKYLNYLKFVKDGKKIARKIGNNFDRVFVSQTGPLTVALSANYIWKKYHVPTSIWTFDMWPDTLYSYGIPKKFPFKQFVNTFVKKVYCRCDQVLVSSVKFKDVLCMYTDKEIVYAPNWKTSNEEDTESSLRLDPSEFNFTFTGNISRAQNLLNLVKGFVKAAIPNARLNIVGDGSAINELESFLISHLEAKVSLRGRLPRSEMQDILKQSNACVISLVTGTALELTEPLKLQDYLLSGKPIFGAIGGSAKEIIEENELGLCSSPTDIDAIAQGFKNMLTFCKENGENISKKSHQLMVTRFDKTQIIERINEAIGISH